MSSEAPRILLVDDEQSVQTLLTYPLRKDGYEVITATTGREALDRFRDGHFDLVVLDVMLPETDGFDVCKQLRARSSVPIIMLTAKAEEFDKVLGLELGADDYITKPFSMREFRSRVKAVLRRAELARNGDAPEEPLDQGELRIDFAKRSVELRGEPVRLTYVEFEILSALARSPGRVFSRQQLIDLLLRGALAVDADQGFGTGEANQDPAAVQFVAMQGEFQIALFEAPLRIVGFPVATVP